MYLNTIDGSHVRDEETARAQALEEMTLDDYWFYVFDCDRINMCSFMEWLFKQENFLNTYQQEIKSAEDAFFENWFQEI